MDKFALVPIKPTAEMLEGFDGMRMTRIDEYAAEIIWGDMISAYIEQPIPSKPQACFLIVVHADGSTDTTIQAIAGDPDTLLATAIAALQAEQREVRACPHHSSNEKASMRTPHLAPPGALGQPPKSGTAVKKAAPDAAASEAGEVRTTYDFDMAYNGGYAAAAAPMQLEIDRLREALSLARPIVEQDWLTAIDYSDADWQGMSYTALEAIDNCLSTTQGGAEG